MINTKKELKKVLAEDKKRNERGNCKENLKNKILYSQDEPIWKYIVLMRKDEYYSNKKGFLNLICKIIIRRKKI